MSGTISVSLSSQRQSPVLSLSRRNAGKDTECRSMQGQRWTTTTACNNDINHIPPQSNTLWRSNDMIHPLFVYFVGPDPSLLFCCIQTRTMLHKSIGEDAARNGRSQHIPLQATWRATLFLEPTLPLSTCITLSVMFSTFCRRRRDIPVSGSIIQSSLTNNQSEQGQHFQQSASTSSHPATSIPVTDSETSIALKELSENVRLAEKS